MDITFISTLLNQLGMQLQIADYAIPDTYVMYAGDRLILLTETLTTDVQRFLKDDNVYKQFPVTHVFYQKGDTYVMMPLNSERNLGLL